MSSPRDPARLRQGLNPLMTSAMGGFGFNNQINTPISALSMASPHVQSAHTPASAIQPYNPQEWVSSPVQIQTAERPVPFTVGETQTSALPPPPYSPPRRNPQVRPVSTAFEHAHVVGTTPPPPSRLSSMIVHRSSPEPPPPRPFPPPPGTTGRGSSRERLFGLASLNRRRDTDQQSSSPEPYHQIPQARRSAAPNAFNTPEPERVVSASTVNAQVAPPSARRAASTGAIDTPTSARSRSASQSRWEPGMPLPPPPPGPPPPSGSRSQSVQSIDRMTVPVISPPTRRPPPTGVAALGPVPPTPADWVDSDTQPSQSGRGRALTIDTTTANDPNQFVEQPLGSSSSLNRAKAVRHDKTILQRRTESRSRPDSSGSIDEMMHPRQISDIVVPAQLGMSKSTPRSAGKRPDLPHTGDSSRNYDSYHSTPRALDSAKFSQHETATPPFSPYPIISVQPSGSSQSTVPKALPTPPPQIRSASSSRLRGSPHPQKSAAVPLTKQTVVNQNATEFAIGTIERYQVFAMKESAAATDADRVRLFADFIVNESRIRRERYSSAIGVMGSEIFDLTRDLFRPMVTMRRESGASQEEWTPASTDPNRSHNGSISSNNLGEGLSNSAPTSAKLSPGGLQMANWGANTTNYMPSLSPILSMSVSDNYENGSSRGRPPSRWWESDSQGDPSRGAFERSKRESKYMGVPKDQWYDTDQGSAVYCSTSEQGSSSEYPPEKTGWHDDSLSSTPQRPRQSGLSMTSSSSPASSTQGLLDVSRLVTLPPPYPRHHPAVNNSHPELLSIRTSVRALSELSEIETAKDIFASSSSKRREEFSIATAERRQSLRINLQREINSGNLSYSDAAAIESDFQEQEKDKKKELEKTEYEQFQNQVIVPLNNLLTKRINCATDLFDDLARHLFDNDETDADMPQEEGDDRPELLEKLTLLKWIFEQRESLHRAIYDLLSDRNHRYREVVLTPYRLAGNAAKLKSAEAFFAEDAGKREYAFANEVLNRAREFRSVMDEAVAHGIELQLSAFWDIAPPLCRLLDNIPMTLGGFGIQIPISEFDENPAYHDHPLQYLYSLLLHAEKSTYQFIEAHTNQLCLLHEVKEAVVNAKARVLATQLAEADGTPISPSQREDRAGRMRQVEGRRLTEELKEKVRVVQDQWHSSLGETVKSVKERTGEWLLQTAGWDETLEDGGVGVA